MQTSSNLNAARLFKPWTLALMANLSFPCRFCHRLDDEDEQRVRGFLHATDGSNQGVKFFEMQFVCKTRKRDKLAVGHSLNEELLSGRGTTRRKSMNYIYQDMIEVQIDFTRKNWGRLMGYDITLGLVLKYGVIYLVNFEHMYYVHTRTEVLVPYT